MVPFARRIALFGVLVVVLLASMLVLHRIYVFSGDSYMLAFKDKHARISSLASPKLVLVGGSNNAFGWDSKRIGEEIGLPTVNMGHYAGHGIEYRLNEIKEYLKKGDIVVLSIEYQILHGHMNDSLPFLSAYADRRSFRYFGLDNWKGFLDRGALIGLRGVVHELVNAVGGDLPEFAHPYRRDSFNEFGDAVAHLQMSPPLRERFAEDIIEEDWRSLRRSIGLINAFEEECREVGARVFIWLPSLPEGVFQKTRTDLLRTVEMLKKETSADLLNDIEDINTEDRLFFDSYYHLREEGRQIRSEKLVEALIKREQGGRQ